MKVENGGLYFPQCLVPGVSFLSANIHFVANFETVSADRPDYELRTVGIKTTYR